MIYAYLRVSTKEQNLDRQIDAVKEYCEDAKIFSDKQSGKDFEREQYKKLKDKICPGDTLIINSIDRLGRNYEQIIQEWKWFRAIHVDIIVLDMPILNTKSQIQGLDGKFISDLVLQILSYVAQKEREKIKERQAQGIAAAKIRGVQFGRPNHIITEDGRLILEKYCRGKLPLQEAISEYGFSRGTFYKDLKQICNYEIIKLT